MDKYFLKKCLTFSVGCVIIYTERERTTKKEKDNEKGEMKND
jgi:hypothetical protein